MSFEGHVDWVNDVTILENTLVSCSNDSTVRLWKANAAPKGTREKAEDDGLLSTPTSSIHDFLPNENLY